ncbi:replication factor C subunit 3 isoform X2 [Prunus yedoensis var. nudiflora]|uniref:Replication factor C subunit 3 isoform X2 n=1 Tax=Prunus yedoensis var. nudiflora TaxID=2094558 RepID=A0A314Y426_PRUYE|nr:replication factor C subunit 3 isoform X2 [Prunus yedoensis var. nudiflora]
MAEVITVMDIEDDNNPSKNPTTTTRAKTSSSPPPLPTAKLRRGSRSTVLSHSPMSPLTATLSTPVSNFFFPRFAISSVALSRVFVDFACLVSLHFDRLTSENRLPHLLLYGPPGTGKTSTILAVARKLYGAQYHNMILELNASDDRGIDVVRQQIQDFASTQSFSFGAKSSVKLVLLDEADAMTKDAQFALRRVIEKYTRNTRFSLICNHVNKIIPALQSRCTRFRFAPLEEFHVSERLKHVIETEGLDVSESGLAAVVRLSNGDMRKALNILQSTHMASQQQITEEAVYLCTGNPLPKDIEQISYWLLNESFAESFKRISDMKTTKGLALIDIVREVTMFVFKIKMPPDVRVQLINDLADIEYRLTFGCNDRLQLGSLVASFTTARSALVSAAK